MCTSDKERGRYVWNRPGLGSWGPQQTQIPETESVNGEALADTVT